uniref:uncharacterized protein n=1 Tax=Myxine glutinosa TaxID=7769 RepID=UPI00358FC558
MSLSEQALQQYTTSWLGDPHRRYSVHDEAAILTPLTSSTPGRKVYLLAARLHVFVGWNPHPPRYLEILQADTCTLLHALEANKKNSCAFHDDVTADMKMPKNRLVRDTIGYVILRDLRDAFASLAGKPSTTAEAMIVTTEVPRIEVTTDEPQLEVTTDEPEVTTDEPEVTTDEPEVTTDEPQMDVTTDDQKEIGSENANLVPRASSSSP